MWPLESIHSGRTTSSISVTYLLMLRRTLLLKTRSVKLRQMNDAQTLPVDEADGLPPKERRMALLTVAIAIAMAVLDGAIANIALPQIARELNATPADSIWVVNAYQLAVTVSLLPLAAMGDIAGYRRVYMFGLS